MSKVQWGFSGVSRKGARAGGGFTLVELLVVILIIAIVIAIVVPSLGRARKVARTTVTQSLLQQTETAAAQFQADSRRPPGYFSQRDMGGDGNDSSKTNGAGLSNMENVLLDLAGGIVKVGGGSPDPANKSIVRAHPYSDASKITQQSVWVDVTLIGAKTNGNKAYFTPDKKAFVAQTNSGTTLKQAGKMGDAPTGGTTLPDLVDAFGQPLLAWVDDESAGAVKFDSGNSGGNNFAREDSKDDPAHFYWASNACFLSSNSLGKLGKDQTTAAGNSASLLGKGRNAETEIEPSMTGLLGNPGFPNAINLTSGSGNPDQIIPLAGRGKVIFQSAGPDGIYLSGTDSKGVNQIKNRVMKYGYAFLNPGDNTVRKDDNGKPTTIDLTAGFDDVIVAGGA